MNNYSDMGDAEALTVIMHNHDCGKEEARFILAIERGEIMGDVAVIDERGNEIATDLGSMI